VTNEEKQKAFEELFGKAPSPQLDLAERVSRLERILAIQIENEKAIVAGLSELGQRIFDLENNLVVDTESKERLDQIQRDVQEMLGKLAVLHIKTASAARRRPPEDGNPGAPSVN
jgi:hypothetical protein